MGRPNKRQRANARLSETRAAATALPEGLDTAPRVPLAGYEGLYEITRSGHVYSVRAKRFIQHAYLDGPYIRFQIGGEAVTLNIADAIEASWGQIETPEYVGAKLVRVTVPTTTFVVFVPNTTDAVSIAIEALAEEIRDRRVRPDIQEIQSGEEIPEGWADAIPYAAGSLRNDDRTVTELLTEYPIRPPSASEPS